MKSVAAPNVDAYIEGTFPGTRELLKQLRSIIKQAAPGATEIISYQMPAYKLNAVLVYFAGYEKHIGFYPGASAIEAFLPQLKKYKTSKGTVHFPLNEPLPVALIQKMVRYKVTANAARAAAKVTLKKKTKKG